MAQHHAPSRNGSVSALHPAGIGFGSTLLGGRFRTYSYATILAILVFGVWAGIQIGQMSANRTDAWLGIVERGNVYAIMLWVAVLAIGLLRAQSQSNIQRTSALGRGRSGVLDRGYANFLELR